MRGKSSIFVVAAAVLLVASSSLAEAKKPPRFTRAAAQKAAKKAAPRMLSKGGTISHTDSDGSYTLAYGPEQLVAVNGCVKALALHGDDFGCHMIVRRNRDLASATGIYATNPPENDGIETYCQRLSLKEYRGKKVPDEVIHDPVFGARFIRVTVPFKKPYKVAVAQFSESCPPGVEG